MNCSFPDTIVVQTIAVVIGAKVILFVTSLLAFVRYLSILTRRVKSSNLKVWLEEYPDLTLQQKVDRGPDYRWRWRHFIYLIRPDENGDRDLVFLKRKVLISYAMAMTFLGVLLIDIALIAIMLILSPT